jgi:hypothetical protein
VNLNLHQGASRSPEQAGPLPGTRKDAYLGVPTLVLLIAGSFVGGAIAIFLPVSGFSKLLWRVSDKMIEVPADGSRTSRKD